MDQQQEQHSERVTEQVRHDAMEWANQAADQGKSLFEEQKRMAAEQVANLANALHVTADRLKDERQESVAHYADWAASSLAHAARYLRENDARHMVDGARDFAWRHPGMFIGGAVVTGLLLSRLLKSSARHSEADYGETGESRAERYGTSDAGTVGVAPSYVRGADYEPPERTDIEL